MFQPKFAASMVIGAATLLIGLSANAHEFIASQSPATAKPGENATLILDSTHQFGLPEEAEGEKDVRATLITTDGKNDIAISVNDDAPNLIGTFEIPENAAWASAHRLGVVWSQTPDGWQAGGADQHPDALASTRYEKFAKLLVGGESTSDFVTTPIGDTLEIVPLSDPRDTKIGDDAEFQILLNGQPLTTSVLATYAGFTETPSSWAYATETLSTENGSGIAKVRVSAPGLWIVRVAADLPDAEEGVGNHNIRATLSFAVDK
ncbi:DUF4198 domain-containing protein [Thalassospira indica]|uniref:DUF4198 domain-containing protein n=1 Tax=Thalassospira indica TaxID=1891279 RepID=A0ABN5NK64_9PROT|nr:DUF4198 domain-containing protein [Thalassospira indica]AXO15793.1 DUF4198 domain-containing protein [Thalassospira indica]OAZ14206.1 hypothetical protein TH15_08275 [Thalassospira profundimaris]